MNGIMVAVIDLICIGLLYSESLRKEKTTQNIIKGALLLLNVSFILQILF